MVWHSKHQHTVAVSRVKRAARHIIPEPHHHITKVVSHTHTHTQIIPPSDRAPVLALPHTVPGGGQCLNRCPCPAATRADARLRSLSVIQLTLPLVRRRKLVEPPA